MMKERGKKFFYFNVGTVNNRVSYQKKTVLSLLSINFTQAKAQIAHFSNNTVY